MPAKGVDNVINVTGFWRGNDQICCAYRYYEFNGTQMDKVSNSTCFSYKMDQLSSFVREIKLPSYASSVTLYIFRANTNTLLLEQTIRVGLEVIGIIISR